jgi:acyl carrier protein
LTTSTACSSSAHAIDLALGAIRTEQADAAIVAGADAPGLDSMATIELLYQIEEAFGAQIPDQDLATLVTVAK